MPTMLQLPQLPVVAADDLLLVEQDGETAVVSVGTLLAGVQPKLTIAGGTLLGRTGFGSGGPEPIGIGAGLAVAAGQIGVDAGVVALLASPAFTGAPTAPTAAFSSASDVLATTAFVQAHIPDTTLRLTGDVAGAGRTGDIVNVVLPDITTAGVFGKVTVNAKGQVVAGAALTGADVSGLDGSGLRVTAGLSGAVGRALGEMRGEVIHVADLLGAKPTGQDATNAMVMALGLAAAMPGSTVELAAGVWNFATLAGPLLVPGRTRIRGAGRHLTQVIWNDTTNFSLFNSTGAGAARVSDIEFSDLTVKGSWSANGAGSNYPFLMIFVDGLEFRNICVEYSRVMGIVARNCVDVTVRGCVVRYCARDGINLSQCSAVTVDGNTVEHCDDDGIAIHSDIYDPWVVRKNVIISNNRVFGCQGIKVLSPRATAVIGNVVDCCRAQGISFASEPVTGIAIEGMAAAAVSLICGNVVTNTIDRRNIDNLNQNAPGIRITGTSARAGTAGAVPGEAKNSNSTIVDPYPYFSANSILSTVATPGAHSLIVSDNFIGRTLPAANNTVTVPRVYARYADYGFGQMFTRTGWINPQLAESDMRDHAILVEGGVVRDVLISGNMIRGMNSGLALQQATRLENIVFRGNQVVDCRSYGVVVNTTGTVRAYIDDNIFDLDPFFRAANRGANGTWSSLGEPTGIRALAGSGVVVRRNVFRNLCRDSDIATDVANSGWLFEGNIVEADPATTGFSTTNKGVGQIRASAGTLLTQAESNPGSTNFGKILTMPTGAATAMPSTGKWLSGHFVRNAAPALAGSLLTLGWTRLTTGSGNVVGTDWSQVVSVGGTVAAFGVLAGPASGAAAAPVFRQLTANDISGVAAAPTVTTTYLAAGAISPGDSVALVNSAVAVVMTLADGSFNGQAIIVKRFGIGKVTLRATIDGVVNASVVMSSATLREAVSLSWSQALASWLMI